MCLMEGVCLLHRGFGKGLRCFVFYKEGLRMKKIAIYGKGGIGKSTTTANVAAALAAEGLRVVQIGCDPKADSTLLHGAIQCPAVLDRLREGGDVPLEEIVREGADGVFCVECGGPVPGTGCAGRGIVAAFDYLKQKHMEEVYRPDVILYDVLGDVVCGGFAMPMRADYARNVFIVTSGEKMSLYAAANIALALERFKNRGYARLTGLIQNSRNVKNEGELVAELAAENQIEVTGIMPRSDVIARAEALGETVVRAFPDSDEAGLYRQLARRMLELSDDA